QWLASGDMQTNNYQATRGVLLSLLTALVLAGCGGKVRDNPCVQMNEHLDECDLQPIRSPNSPFVARPCIRIRASQSACDPWTQCFAECQVAVSCDVLHDYYCQDGVELDARGRQTLDI